uniref:Transmembrane protein n=1 Tax=Ascaris lumbricoides TaxID=6252 RepID=A0A0M3HSU9_ASCLU
MFSFFFDSEGNTEEAADRLVFFDAVNASSEYIIDTSRRHLQPKVCAQASCDRRNRSECSQPDFKKFSLESMHVLMPYSSSSLISPILTFLAYIVHLILLPMQIYIHFLRIPSVRVINFTHLIRSLA